MAIRDNLEFRADELVVRNADVREYQLTMLSMVRQRVRLPLFTELNSSNLKKRIIMMKSENSKSYTGIAKLAIIPVFTILLVSLSGKETAIVRDTGREDVQIEAASNPGRTFTVSENMQDGLKSINDMRRFMADNFRYPREAAESGQMGRVGLYAVVDGDGDVGEVTELQPEGDYIDIDEIVIVGYGMEGIEPVESSRHQSLLSEGRRVVRSFPGLDIPEIKGRTIKLNIIFVLQPGTRNDAVEREVQKDSRNEADKEE